MQHVRGTACNGVKGNKKVGIKEMSSDNVFRIHVPVSKGQRAGTVQQKEPSDASIMSWDMDETTTETARREIASMA
jgi:hypothetical protein